MSEQSLPSRPWRTGAGLLLPLALVLLLLLVLAGAGIYAFRWAFFTEPGAQWVLARVPAVKAEGVRGALLGRDWQAEKLQFTWAGGNASLVLEGVRAEGFDWSWQPVADAWLGLKGDRLSARKATWTSGPPSATPLKLPQSLSLPIQAELKALRVDELVVDTLAPARAIEIDGLVVNNRRGQAHELRALRGRWSRWRLEGSAKLGHAAPLPLSAQLNLVPDEVAAQPDDAAVRWAAVLRAEGPLAAFRLDATLRGVPRPGATPPALDLAADIRPEQPWPLGALKAQTRELDLSALNPAWPQTRLEGTADVVTRGMDQPLAARLRLSNAAPGRWNERRLPLRTLEAELAGSLARRDRIEAPRIELQLADATQPAGTLRGKAQWLGTTLTLDVAIDQLSPQRLDSRAAAMTLSGPVQLTLNGLPALAPAGAASAPAAAPAPSASVKLELQGQLDARPVPVSLKLAARGDARGVEVQELRATSGGAVAEAQATLQRHSSRGWAVATRGTLKDFDPLPWFPGDSGSAWQKGPHRLSADWQLDARLPANATALAPLALLPRVAGNGRLRLRDSVLAGVPLSADATLGYRGSAGGADTGSLDAEVRLASNRLVLEGRGDPAGDGRADRLRAELAADNLAALAPLARLHPALADWVPRAGTATASATVAGRWPELKTEGQLRTQALAVGALAIARGQASWTLDTGGGQPLAVKLDAAGLRWGPAARAQQVRQLTGDVSGTMAAHRIDVVATTPGAPSAQAGRLLGLPQQAGTRGVLVAGGSWERDAGGGGRWHARIERLLLAPWDGREAAPSAAAASSTAAPAAQAAWADARDLRAELRFDGEGSLTQLSAEPGRLRLADAATLRWDAVRLDLSGTEPLFSLNAEVEPFPVAPLLARLQPGMGWAGDLKVGARVRLDAAERMVADVSLARQDGDLHIAGGDGLLLLGLTELRGALSARDGLWRFDVDAAGRSLGTVRGTLSARAAPERRWPSDDAPVEGRLEARVADIGIWNNFLPPGWRLAGEMRAEASVAGRFGERQYTGQVVGTKLALRNLLQGVAVSDGELAVRLDGETARIERFVVKGGDGKLTLTGGGRIGERWQARAVADRFRVLGRVDRQLTVSGQAEVEHTDALLRVDGRVRADEGLFDISRADAPSLDGDVSLRRAEPEALPADEQAAAPVRRELRVALELDMGDQLRLRGRGLDTGLRGQLRVSTPNNRWAVNGTIDAEGGTYAAYAQKLEIERGLVFFTGSFDNPRLDVLALRPNLDMRVGLAITGNLLTPRVRLYSEPEMSESEKMSWLLLGRASDGLGRNDTALVQRAAMALLAGEGEAPTDTLLRNLGITDFGLRQSDGDTRETIVSLGRQLSRRWYLGYERSVNATAGTWQLIYRIAQRFTLRAQSGLENSLDAIWVWRTGEAREPTGPAEQRVRKSVPLPPAR
jgi:translocation and assembly module TamB